MANTFTKEEDKFIKLHYLEFSDRWMGEKLGKTRKAVGLRRRKLKLYRGRVTPLEDVKRYLYDFKWNYIGLFTCLEIGDMTGNAIPTVYNHTNKNKRLGGIHGWYVTSEPVDENMKGKYFQEL